MTTRWILTILVGYFLTASSGYASTSKGERLSKANQHHPQKCSKLLALVAGGIVGIVLALPIADILSPRSVLRNRLEDRKAMSAGKQHIGYGIWYSFQEILTKFPESEQEILLARKDKMKIAELVMVRLHGDYDSYLDVSNISGENYNGRSAASFLTDELFSEIVQNDQERKANSPSYSDLKPSANNRGVCRHKVMIAARFLNDLGIVAKAMRGGSKNGNDSAHAWIEIPDINMAFDPTRDDYSNIRWFYKMNGIEEAHELGKPWGLGNLKLP